MTLRINTWKHLSFTLLACSAMACGTEQIIGQGELGTGGNISVGGNTGAGGANPSTGGTASTGGVVNIATETGGAWATGGSAAIASTTSTSVCYAPSTDLSPSIYSDPTAKGCACDSTKEEDVCINGVALVCSSGYWQAVIDGPCGLPPPAQGVCYSPSANLSPSIFSDPTAKGCACDSAKEADVCVNGMALTCANGTWEPEEDGPCEPRAPARFSPSGCTDAGGTPIASPGSPITAEKDCPSGVALGVITSALSGWVDGGLCCAPTEYNKACGGRAGNTCSQTEYCAYEEGGDCGFADGQSVCKPQPIACDHVYTPVCACNQMTYGNACDAAAAGFGVLHAGKCG